MSDSEKMPITAVLKKWLENEEWEDEILNNGEMSYVSTTMDINGQGHELFFECHESIDRFKVYLYPPYKVPEARIKDAAVLLNRINLELGLGRLACTYTGDSPGVIQFMSVVDVEDTELSVVQISIMLGAGVRAFEKYGSVMGAVAFTKYPVDTIWQEFLDEAEDEAEDEAPKEL